VIQCLWRACAIAVLVCTFAVWANALSIVVISNASSTLTVDPSFITNPGDDFQISSPVAENAYTIEIDAPDGVNWALCVKKAWDSSENISVSIDGVTWIPATVHATGHGAKVAEGTGSDILSVSVRVEDLTVAGSVVGTHITVLTWTVTDEGGCE